MGTLVASDDHNHDYDMYAEYCYSGGVEKICWTTRVCMLHGKSQQIETICLYLDYTHILAMTMKF